MKNSKILKFTDLKHNIPYLIENTLTKDFELIILYKSKEQIYSMTNSQGKASRLIGLPNGKIIEKTAEEENSKPNKTQIRFDGVTKSGMSVYIIEDAFKSFNIYKINKKDSLYDKDYVFNTKIENNIMKTFELYESNIKPKIKKLNGFRK